MKKLILTVLLVLLVSYSVVAADDKLNIAVIDFEAQPPVSPAEAAFITEFFRGALVTSDVFNVIDKKNMDNILAEQGFQQTGCTTSECAVKLGKVLNTRQMINGKFGKLAGKYMLTISVVDVESGKIVYTDSQSSRDIDNIKDDIDKLAERYVKDKGKKFSKKRKEIDYFNDGNLISISFLGGTGITNNVSYKADLVFKGVVGGNIKYIFSRRLAVGLGYNIDFGRRSDTFTYAMIDYKFILLEKVKYFATIGYMGSSQYHGSYINLALGMEIFPGKIKRNSVGVEINSLMNFYSNPASTGLNDIYTYLLFRINFCYSAPKLF